MCVLTALEDLQRRLADVAVPMLTIQGDSDKLCEKSGAELLHRLSPSTDKKLSVSDTWFARFAVFLTLLSNINRNEYFAK